MLELLLEARDLVGADHRHAGERQLQRHRPRGGERGAGGAKGRELGGLADHDARLDRPACGARAHFALHMRQGRQDDLERAAIARQQRQRARRNRPSAARSPSGASPAARRTSGGSAARRRASSAFGRNSREPLDQGMADIDAARAAEPRVRGRLERQQRQHAIDIGAHRLGAPRPPRPDRRADVVDDRQVGQRAPHAPRDAMGEVGAVDDDERVGPRRRRRPRRSDESAPARSAVSPATGRKPITAMSPSGNRLFSPSASIASPPTPQEFDVVRRFARAAPASA